MQTITDKLGQFVSGLDNHNLPPEVSEKAKACLLNAYGVGIGSNHLPYYKLACDAAIDSEGEHPNGATLLGDGRKTTPAGAALAHAVLFHARTQEDFTWGSTHAGVVLVPVITAIIEAKRLPVNRLLPALVAGYEVTLTLDQAYASRLTANGFRGTPILGAIGAAAAVSKLYGLNAARTSAALSYAAGIAGGTLQSQSEGSDEWRYQVGVCGGVGIMAAHLAKAGAIGASQAFEGRAGFARTYAKSETTADDVGSRLGKDWMIRNVFFKPYPVPAWNQTPVELALRIREKLAGRRVRRVEVRMNPYEVNYPGKNSKGPFDNATSAKLSMAFSIAITLAHGMPTFAQQLDYNNEATVTMLETIQLVGDEKMQRLCCAISIECEDGLSVKDELLKRGEDYSFGCDRVSELIRAIGKESGVPDRAYQRLDSFVRRLPGGSGLQDVIDAFALMPRMTT